MCVTHIPVKTWGYTCVVTYILVMWMGMLKTSKAGHHRDGENMTEKTRREARLS
jgi:hypothetical protein